MGKKVRTLLRVSSRQQLHDNDIPVQRAEAEEYIAKHTDWEFDKEYIEKAVSAYKNGVEDREILQEILSDAKERQFDILLAYMSDRIGRQEEYSFYVAALNRLGIEVWTIRDGQLKTEEHIDKLLNYIRFWQNEGESKKTGMRVRDTQRELVKSGKFVGGKAPFGYRLVPSGLASNHGRMLKKLEVSEEHAEVVRKIYCLAVQEGMGYERIAKELNRLEIPAISAGKWKAGTVRGILTNPIYMGYLAIGRRRNNRGLTRTDRREWTYSEKPVKELEVVSPAEWEKAQQIREARKEKIKASKDRREQSGAENGSVPFRTGSHLMLLGLAYCGCCGKRLKNGSYHSHWVTKDGERKTSFAGRYLCPEKCGERSCYSQNYLERPVLQAAEICLGHLRPIDMAEEWRNRQKKQREKAEKELREVSRAEAALKRDILTLEEKLPEAIRGEYCFSEEKLFAIIREKEQRLKEWEEKGKRITDILHETMIRCSVAERQSSAPPDWAEEFRSAGADVKRMVLFTLIDKIIVKDGEICVRFRISVRDIGLRMN